MFTIVTFVTDDSQYADMLASFAEQGFADCVFVKLDNSNSNKHEPYSAINKQIAECQTKWLIVVHQDVLLKPGSTFCKLRQQIAKLPLAFGIAGCAGRAEAGKFVGCVSDPNDSPQYAGQLPAEVATLDECFLLLNIASQVQCSTGLSGWHCYGTDLCLSAKTLGNTAHVLNFPIEHLSGGSVNADYHACKRALTRQWAGKFEPGFKLRLLPGHTIQL